jgi:CRISPR type III-B/RAMP module-associated protein Cmr3
MATEFWIQPLEPLFFGPPNSFTAGEAHHTSSMFPPSPWAFQGIVRTHLLGAAERQYGLSDSRADAVQEREELIGTPDAMPGGWRLSPAVPVVMEERRGLNDRLQSWFPAPRFLFAPYGKDASPLRAQILPVHGWEILDDTASWESRGNALVMGPPPSETKARPLRGWVDSTNLRWALTGRGSWRPEGYQKDVPPFVKRERQAGVAIDDQSGTARDQLLYTMERLRFKEKSGFWGKLETPRTDPRLRVDALRRGLGQAGRRARSIEFGYPPEKHEDWQAIEEGADLPQEVPADGPGARFWLYLASPVFIGANQSAPELRRMPGSDVRITVRSASLGRPAIIGGRTIKNGVARGNRPHVPAGSVWLIELSGGNPQERASVLRWLHGGNPAGPEAETSFGFGRTFAGALDTSLR